MFKYAAPDSYAAFTNKKIYYVSNKRISKTNLIEDKMNREMLKEAIAEAKTIKETAIASAKAALEEAFTPQLTAMFAERLNEMELEEEAEATDENFSLEEILAELGVTEEEEMMAEGDKSEETIDEDLMLEEMSDEDIEELVTQVIDDMIASGKLMAGEESEEDLEDMEDMNMDDMGDEVEVEDEDEVKIDELLAEILGEEKEQLEEGAGLVDILDLIANGNFEAAANAAEQGLATAGAGAAALGTAGLGIGAAALKAIRDFAKERKAEKGNNDSTKEEMEETIAELRAELNEVNLLNAKLLYTNKIFKAKNLTESEKVKVLNTFDKAETVKEVKLVFETLTESFKATAKKNPIKESLGSASRTIAAAPKQEQIIEVNDAFARMQRLAGLRK